MAQDTRTEGTEGNAITEIRVQGIAPAEGWLTRLRLALKSSYVINLEAQVGRLQEENRLLLDRLLGLSGIAPLTAAQLRGAHPSAKPMNPLRVMRAREATAWQEFNEMFPTNMDEVAKERKG